MAQADARERGSVGCAGRRRRRPRRGVPAPAPARTHPAQRGRPARVPQWLALPDRHTPAIPTSSRSTSRRGARPGRCSPSTRASPERWPGRKPVIFDAYAQVGRATSTARAALPPCRDRRADHARGADRRLHRLRRHRRAALHRADAELLQRFATHAAIAIANSRLHEESANGRGLTRSRPSGSGRCWRCTTRRPRAGDRHPQAGGRAQRRARARTHPEPDRRRNARRRRPQRGPARRLGAASGRAWPTAAGQSLGWSWSGSRRRRG